MTTSTEPRTEPRILPAVILSRLLHIAYDACKQCDGPSPHQHIHNTIQVGKLLKHSIHAPARAVGLYSMTNGFCVVFINGETFARWWLPTLDVAEAFFADVDADCAGPEDKIVPRPRFLREAERVSSRRQSVFAGGAV